MPSRNSRAKNCQVQKAFFHKSLLLPVFAATRLAIASNLLKMYDDDDARKDFIFDNDTAPGKAILSI